MVKLNEIEAAKAKDEFDEAHRLKEEWHAERGLTAHFAAREVYMRYIERLEDDRQRLLVTINQLLVMTHAFTGYEQSIVAKAHHLIKVMEKHEQEEVKGT